MRTKLLIERFQIRSVVGATAASILLLSVCAHANTAQVRKGDDGCIRVEADSPKKEYAGELEHRLDFSFTGEVLKPCKNSEDLELYGQPTRAWLVNFLGIAAVDSTNKRARLAVPATAQERITS